MIVTRGDHGAWRLRGDDRVVHVQHAVTSRQFASEAVFPLLRIATDISCHMHFFCTGFRNQLAHLSHRITATNHQPPAARFQRTIQICQ